MNEIVDSTVLAFIERWLPLVVVCVLYGVAHHLVERWKKHQERVGQHTHYRQQALSLALGLVALLMVIVAAPLDHDLQGQLLSLFGIIVSAALALSSTTLMGNLMAGLMLRVVNSFHIGDFVKVEGQLGRVSGVSLLHVEVQTADSDLLTIPNLALVQKPFTVVRAEGTVIHSDVSLGYDIPVEKVEAALLKAVQVAELEDGFVQIQKLGDFSIVYTVHARLNETKRMVSAKARLNKAMIECLYDAGIEIVSPTYMNQRVITHAGPILAPSKGAKLPESELAIESLLFEKAEQAELVERLEKRLRAVKKRVMELEKGLAEAKDEEKPEAEEKLARWRKREAQVQFLLDEAKE